MARGRSVLWIAGLIACGGGAANASPGNTAPAPAVSGGPQTDAEPLGGAGPDAKAICAQAKDVKISAIDREGVRGARPWLDDDRGTRSTPSSAKAKDVTYTMADLQALEKKSAWEELLDHAEDIPPAQRDATWEKIVEHAGIGYMDQVGSNSQGYAGVFASQTLTRRYPHLTKSTAFMTKRGEAGKSAAEACFRDSYNGGRCIEMMQDFLKTPNTSVDVGFAFGKITRKNQFHYVAVPFFKWALEQKHDPSACGDPDVKMAVIAGLGLPPDYDNAGGSRSIAARLCFDNLKAEIQKQLSEDKSSYYRDNACAVLKAKGAL